MREGRDDEAFAVCGQETYAPGGSLLGENPEYVLSENQHIVQLIAATTTRTGLNVKCEIDHASYPAGIKIADEDMAAINIIPNPFHGGWNYMPSHDGRLNVPIVIPLVLSITTGGQDPQAHIAYPLGAVVWVHVTRAHEADPSLPHADSACDQVAHRNVRRPPDGTGSRDRLRRTGSRRQHVGTGARHSGPPAPDARSAHGDQCGDRGRHFRRHVVEDRERADLPVALHPAGGERGAARADIPTLPDIRRAAGLLLRACRAGRGDRTTGHQGGPPGTACSGMPWRETWSPSPT